MISGRTCVAGGVVHAVWIAHFLQIDVSIGRVHLPTAFDETQREVLAGIGAAGVHQVRSDAALTVGDHIMSKNAPSSLNRDVSRLRPEGAGASVAGAAARWQITDNIAASVDRNIAPGGGADAAKGLGHAVIRQPRLKPGKPLRISP